MLDELESSCERARALVGELHALGSSGRLGPDALDRIARVARGASIGLDDPTERGWAERIALAREQMGWVPWRADQVAKRALKLALSAPPLAFAARQELASWPETPGRDATVVELVRIPIALKQQAAAVRAKSLEFAARADALRTELDQALDELRTAVPRALPRVGTEELVVSH